MSKRIEYCWVGEKLWFFEMGKSTLALSLEDIIAAGVRRLNPAATGCAEEIANAFLAEMRLCDLDRDRLGDLAIRASDQLALKELEANA